MLSVAIHYADVLPVPPPRSTVTALLPLVVFLALAGAITTAVLVFRHLIRKKPPS